MSLHIRLGREGAGEEVIWVRSGDFLTADWPHSFTPSFLALRFYYIYLYSTAGGVQPAAGMGTNQFAGRDGDWVRSRVGLDLAFDLWLSRQHHLDSCLIWRRQQPVSGSFFLITCPLRVLLGYHIRLANWTLVRLLCGSLTQSHTRCLTVVFDAPWAAPPLTKFLGPELSDLLTNLLLQPGI